MPASEECQHRRASFSLPGPCARQCLQRPHCFSGSLFPPRAELYLVL